MRMTAYCRRPIRGMTLVELTLSLTILSIISTSVVYMLAAACNLNSYAQNESSAVWEIDFSWHRISANGLAAIPSGSGGMTPTVTTDANGQSRLTFIVPDQANSTTRTVKYYCTGSAAPYTLVEDDPRYDVAGTPSTIAHNVQLFAAGIDASTTMKITCDLRINPPAAVAVERHFVVNCRDF